MAPLAMADDVEDFGGWLLRFFGLWPDGGEDAQNFSDHCANSRFARTRLSGA